MENFDLIFEEMVFSRDKNLYLIYTATMKHLKIDEKSDVIAVVMTTVTFQYNGYLKFKQILLENKFCDPTFYFREQFPIVH